MKTLFIHVPKFNNFYKPIGEFMWLNYMPVGLLAIADYVRRHGMETEVVHLGVEWMRDRSLRIEDLVKDRPEIKAVGFSLHWHHQAYDVIRAAGRIKAARPDMFVFAGGDTASFFHEEVVRDFPEIDAVVRGYAEVPVLGLVRTLRDGGTLEKVPNLTWREGETVRSNGIAYTGLGEAFEDLTYTRFSLLRNPRFYTLYSGVPFFFAKRFTPEQNFRHFTLRSPVFPLPVGRGCPFTCTWCGGSQASQRRFVSGLNGFVYLPHERVVRTVREALALGYERMHTAMDPEPVEQEYFVELWRRIRREKIHTRWIFECNGLPSERFLNEFKKTFPDGDSVIALSPECGNEALRRRHKGPGFSTAAFFEKMDRIDSLGIPTEIFFTYGLPWENEDMIRETVGLQRKIRRKYRHVRAVRTLSVEMEPGAPWNLDPERFGIVTNRRTFRDFYEAHANPLEGTFTSFGYYVPDFFRRPLYTERPFEDFAERMQRLKCRHFCFIHPAPQKGAAPWAGRIFCGAVSKLVALKRKDRSEPY